MTRKTRGVQQQQQQKLDYKFMLKNYKSISHCYFSNYVPNLSYLNLDFKIYGPCFINTNHYLTENRIKKLYFKRRNSFENRYIFGLESANFCEKRC